jgi:alkanesulfonate monooxygenase SsuD/methylene tetrahydromethanopterin reductase-like flavin-dependent oxidoreductase (luciferase family)
LAEELAMLDCMSNGRLISGFARGIPREYQVHNVPLAQSRARFEEAFHIITRAWTEEIFSYDGVFWSYKDVALWPRPVQRPRPPIWMPIVGSKESIEFAARNNLVTPASVVRWACDASSAITRAARAGGHRSIDHLSLGISVMSPRVGGAMAPPLYFNRPVQPRHLPRPTGSETGYSSAGSTD